ncbi:hypothetical protein KKH03_05140, partial [Patescibacteria group bacterium]|nr:hypothetical protein [Patescibacteria group bacterium]
MADKFEAQQANIKALEAKAEKEEKALTLKERLKANHNTFFEKVYSIKDDLSDAEKSIKDKNNLTIVNNEADQLAKYLRSVALTGETAFFRQTKGEKAEAELSQIDSAAGNINKNVAAIEKYVPQIKTIESADTAFTEKGMPLVSGVLELQSNQKLSPVDKRDQLVKSADETIDELANAKKILKQLPTGSVEGLIGTWYENVAANIDEKLKDMGEIKLYYDVREFASSDKYKRYLIFDEETGEIKKTEAFIELDEEEKTTMLLELHSLRKSISDEIGEKCAVSETEKNFYKAKKLLKDGKFLEAKDILLEYRKTQKDAHFVESAPVTYVDSEGKVRVAKTGEGQWEGMSQDAADQFNEATTLLQQIALMELSQARARFAALQQSIEAQWASPTGENSLGLSALQSKAKLMNMEKVLEKAESIIKSGKAVDLQSVIDQLKTIRPESGDGLEDYQTGFWVGMKEKSFRDIFDVLEAQQRINSERDPYKRSEMALAEAKKAYSQGFFALSRMYYDEYFEPELKNAAKRVKRPDIEEKMRNDTDLQMQIWNQEPKMREKVSEKYRQENNGAEIPSDNLDSIVYKMKGKMFQLAVDSAYQKAVKAEAHDMMEGVIIGKGAEWNDVYSNTFVNLEYHKERNWYQLWKFTNEEWEGFLTTLMLDVGLLFVSVGMGNIAKTGATRLMLGQLAKAGAKEAVMVGAENALKQGFKGYCKFIVKELGWKKATALGLGSLGVESGVAGATNSALNGVVRNVKFDSKEYLKSWGRMALMMGASKFVNFGFSSNTASEGAFKEVEKIVLEQVADESLSAGLEIALMGMSGEEITQEKVRQIIKDNVVYAVAMPVAMRGVRKLSGEAAEAPVKADESTKKLIEKALREAATKKSEAKPVSLAEAEPIPLTRRKDTLPIEEAPPEHPPAAASERTSFDVNNPKSIEKVDVNLDGQIFINGVPLSVEGKPVTARNLSKILSKTFPKEVGDRIFGMAMESAKKVLGLQSEAKRNDEYIEKAIQTNEGMAELMEKVGSGEIVLTNKLANELLTTTNGQLWLLNFLGNEKVRLDPRLDHNNLYIETMWVAPNGRKRLIRKVAAGNFPLNERLINKMSGNPIDRVNLRNILENPNLKVAPGIDVENVKIDVRLMDPPERAQLFKDVHEGKIPLSKHLIDKLMTSSDGMKDLARFFESGSKTEIAPGIDVQGLKSEIEAKKQRFGDKENLAGLRNNMDKKAFAKLLAGEVEAIKAGKKPAENNVIGNILGRLAGNDPALFEALVKGDMERIVNTEALEAMVAGRKLEFTD